MADETAPSLHAIPVRFATVWVPKIVTTDPPRLVPHTEWRLDVKIVAATVIRAVPLLQLDATTWWALPPDPAHQEVDERALFSPYDWNASNTVVVNFAGRRIEVDDPALKDDPRTSVNVVAPEVASTGSVVRLAEIPKHRIRLSALILDESDIERQRSQRWRVRPRLKQALPPFLADLTSGRQTGVTQAW